MTTKMKVVTVYDPVVGRWRAICDGCGRVAVRSKREAAVHAIEQHVAYEHGAEVAK